MAPGAGKVQPNLSLDRAVNAGLAVPRARGPGSRSSAEDRLVVVSLLCAFRARMRRFLKIKLCRIVWAFLFVFFNLLLKTDYVTAGAGVWSGWV